MKKLTLVLAALLLSRLALAQCNCPAVANFAADFCYQHPAFMGLCAQFKTDGTNFYLQNAGKARALASPASASLAEGLYLGQKDSLVLATVLDLAKNPKAKLTAPEALFLQKAWEAWMVELNKTGFQTDASGLGIKLLKEGNGPLPTAGQQVKVHYSGLFENGAKFESSFGQGPPIAFPLGQGRVIKGWDQGIAQLKVGSRAVLRVPAELGYGARGRGMIPPNATLYFLVEIVGVE
ncbi:MAG: FKBP-type peptidyl-prolyl cis-trans isomerase [Bernardetiaceae bacterium]|jgi:FKBP-type peptidyl-prolyl cis-trans isomerase|nr:FKBP-type peptidyl-prolyl cis-trans isomerase [Bernardetiaceae bacterium]